MNRIENKPMPGDVLSVIRGIYKHYGVYVGNDTVVHFSGGEGFELSAKRACIRKTSLENFRKNDEIQIETRCCESYSRKETVMRALGAVGTEKGKYARVLTRIWLCSMMRTMSDRHMCAVKHG
jgi:hypothetical protein